MSLLLLFGTAFNDIRQDIIDGLDSAQSEANGWDAQRVNIPLTAVVRTSDTVVTITLPALAAYDITALETITATIPGVAVASGSPIVATPTFDIDEVAAGVGGPSSVTSAGRVTGTAQKNAAAVSTVRAAGVVTASTTSNVTRASSCSAGGRVVGAIRKAGLSTGSATGAGRVAGSTRKNATAISIVRAAGNVTGTGTSAEAHTGASTVSAAGRVTSTIFVPEAHAGASTITAAGRVTSSVFVPELHSGTSTVRAAAMVSSAGFKPAFSPAARVVAHVVGGPLVRAQAIGRRTRKHLLIPV